LWPDPVTSATLQQIWDKLAARGLPSLATRTHRRHQPHCSLTVAEHLPVDETLTAVGVVPTQPLPLRIESVGVFPTMGTLFFAPVVTDELLASSRSPGPSNAAAWRTAPPARTGRRHRPEPPSETNARRPNRLAGSFYRPPVAFLARDAGPSTSLPQVDPLMGT
jgi:hypothetical protein